MKKKFDLKPLLIEKGERIGICAAAALSVLLVVMGVLKGFSAGSSTANAKKLNDQLTSLENRQRSAAPGDAHKPQDTINADALAALKFKEVPAGEFGSVAVFTSPRQKDNKRQRPNVLHPDEYAVDVVRVALTGLSFQFQDTGERRVPTHVHMIPARSMGGAAGAAGAMGGAPPGAGAGPGLGGLIGSGSGRGAMGGAPGAGGVTGRRPGRFNPRPTFGKAVEGGEKLETIPVAEAENKRDKELAIRALPMRMGIVTMSFPFQAQVEEFRQKLRLEKHGDVLTERVRGEKDDSWNSFQFRGFEVERAEFDPLRSSNRNLRPEDWKPKEEDVGSPGTELEFAL